MRYEIDANGYIKTVAFGCTTGECNEYTGTTPSGYSSLVEWSENAYINAYYIKDGNLVLDEERLAEIQEKEVQDAIDNTPVLRKDIFGSEQVLGSQYIRETATGEVIKIENIQTVAPRLKVTGIQPSEYTKLNIYTNGSNMMPLNDINKTISGVTISKNSNGWLMVSGMATEDIELTIAGSETNTEPLFALKKNHKYILHLGNYECELRYFDGDTTSQVYVGSSSNAELNLSESAKVTQVIIKIPKSDYFTSNAFLPFLAYESKITDTYKLKTVSIDFSNYIESEDTTVEYILIEGGYVRASINGVERIIGTGNLGLHSACSTIYALEDVTLEIEYSTNVYDVESLKFLQGKATTSNGFMITEDGGVIATEGNIGGWNIGDTNIYKTYEASSTRVYRVSLNPMNGGDSDFLLAEYSWDGGETYHPSMKITTTGTALLSDVTLSSISKVEDPELPNLNINAPIVVKSVVTSSGADLDVAYDNSRWRKCTIVAASTYGYFYNTPRAKYRYTEDVLEICVQGVWVSKVAVAEGQPLMKISGLDIAIPSGANGLMWDDTAQIWRLVKLGEDGYIKLGTNANIPANSWLSGSPLNFTLFRTS